MLWIDGAFSFPRSWVKTLIQMLDFKSCPWPNALMSQSSPPGKFRWKHGVRFAKKMKYGYVERAVKFCAPATRTSTCWHMHRSTIILSVCHFRISRSGASNAMHIWMFLPFQSSTPYIELLMSQSSAISLVFQVRYQKLEQELPAPQLPAPPDKTNGTATILVTSHKLQLFIGHGHLKRGWQHAWK